MKLKPITVKKINALLSIYFFLAILVGLRILNILSGQDYYLFALWLALAGGNIIIIRLLTEWIFRLEAKNSKVEDGSLS